MTLHLRKRKNFPCLVTYRNMSGSLGERETRCENTRTSVSSAGAFQPSQTLRSVSINIYMRCSA